MSEIHRNEDNLGAIIVEVQDDLLQLKSSLEKIIVNDRGTTLDIQALDNAICRTEKSIRKHAEDYLKTVNKQLYVLPSIEDFPKQSAKIPQWKPLEAIPHVHPQKKNLLGASPGEKQKFNRNLMCNPANPSNRQIVPQKCGISLPDVVKKNINTTKHQRKIVVSGCHFPSIPEDDMRTVLQPSLLSLAVQHKAASLHPKEDTFKTGSNSRCDDQQKWETNSESPCVRKVDECTPLWATKTPLPSTTSMSMGQSEILKGTSSLIPKTPQVPPVEVPVNTTKFPFTIIKGQIDPMAIDFSHFKQNFSMCWSSVVDMLEVLKELLGNFAVPVGKVSGERLVELCRGWENGWRKTPSVNTLLSVLENQEEVFNLVSSPGQRYKGEGGIEAAAIRIQSCWRRYLARTAYLCHLRRKWAVDIITISWKMRAQIHRTRKALQARRNSQLENSRSRAQHLAANWKRIQSSKRTIIHIPSLGYSQSQRLNLRRFDILQNIQISRLFDIRDKNVEVIYICPQHLGDDILDYYNSLLKCDGATDGADTIQTLSSRRRFIILTPEAVDYFPTHNMCLSTLLKYSPRTLKRIRNLICGKQAYIVGGVSHMDDLAVADELDVPILAPDPAVFQLNSTKSEGRRIFDGAKVDTPPGQGDVCSLQQEPVLLRYLDEIPEWLAHYAQPAKTSCYPSWACFLKTFLRQGGVVEAKPPSESVTYLTVDMLLEPGGEVTMLSCGDQLHGSCQLEAIGTTVPQTSVHPETLHSVCMRVGQTCLQRLIVGYVSVDLATFLDHNTVEQKVWAVDLNIAYSDQLAMTQMLLMVTGGTLNWHTGFLEVPMPVREKVCEHQIASKVVNCYAVIGSHLFHSNLFMLYHNTFLKTCKIHGIGFNMKKRQGTVFALFDMRERCSIGMITVSDDLQGALVTFARNLSVIYQEISSSKMQGETNFKELVKNIEDVLQMTVQNKRLLKDKPAA
ncbi:IQ motif-containing protein H isoform X2 [Melanotaenia boesemani]|uniref:IQ motif-containing protein H isoform X2 n=1 Tax=Melanotaenia boesemani TaxID=1250792 RepID=UPI001C03C046|nr:IQ motif-containing protein H isoform X2 [Melanotaenia boesemani]